jgi:sugar/nucleoside kinase (ribokinase family)
VSRVRFVAVGDLMVDVIARGAGHEARIRVAAGGSAANAARVATACGAEATAVGAVGDDAAGRLLRAELEAAAVRPELAVLDGVPTGTFLVVDGEIRADRGANAALSPHDLPPRIDADAVLVSGYLPPEAVDAALARARAAWVALAAARLRDLPPGGNAVFANDEEARRLTGLAPREAVQELAGRYRLACVTLGRDGAIAVLDGRAAFAAPPSRVEAGEPGAGDAFAAALLVALMRGDGLEAALAEACRRGMIAAAGPG